MRESKTAACSLLLICAALAGCKEVPLSGIVYHDANRSSVSDYAQRLDGSDVRLAGVSVHLLDAAGERQTVTDTTGSFAFDGLGSGTYLLDADINPADDCTSNNHPRRLPLAIREGNVHIVSIGDSESVKGSDVPFPVRLASRISAIAPTTLENLAVPGTATWDWLPGAETGYFDRVLAPALSDADVVTITLGGNDLVPYIGDPPSTDPQEILARFLAHPEYLLNIVPNLATIIGAIRAQNPDCDIVYVIYPNVMNSTLMGGLLGELQPLGSAMASTGLSMIRKTVSGIEGIVIADVFGALGNASLDPYLSDEVHPNDKGHQLYADVVFRALGGVVLEAGSTESRMFGFFAPDLVPE